MIQSRVMALDVGDRTVGIALSDELRLTAQPLKTIRHKGEHEFKKIFTELTALLESQNVTTIVIGLPINMNGSEGPQAAKVRDFTNRWQKFLDKNEKKTDALEWICWDERLSTAGAERHLIDADVSRNKRREVIDTMAAVFILQGYLSQLVHESL